MASENSVNGDFMPVDMSTSSLSPSRVVPPNWQRLVNHFSRISGNIYSPSRQRPMNSFSLSPRNTPYPSRPIRRSYGAVRNYGRSRQTVVIGSSLADRVIDSGVLFPILQSAGLAGSPLPSNITIAGVDINDHRVIPINTLLQATEEMPAQPGVLSPNSVGNEFWRQYCTNFKTNREMLRCLYTENSVLTFQGVSYLGAEAITCLLECLPQEWDPSIVTMDCCQCGSSDPVTILVTGDMHNNSNWQLSGPAVELLSPLIESTRSSFKFCQSFHLKKNLEGNYYVSNEIFRKT